jgi:hypothetical protein
MSTTTRTVDDMIQWEAMRKAKIEAKRLELEQEKDKAMVGKPMLVTKSTNNGLDNRKVQDRLLEYEEKRKIKIQQIISQQDIEMKRNSTPQLDVHSKSIKRDGNVVDRLYNLAVKQINGNDNDNNQVTQHDYLTGQRLFQV